MIEFPLKIHVFKNQDGMWRASTFSPGIEVSHLAQTREQALGEVFWALKNIPGFHLWTFNIVILDEDGMPVDISLPTEHEMQLFKNIGKINAIKAYRERTGLRLKECKDAIEKEAVRLRLNS